MEFTIAFQPELSLNIPNMINNKEYKDLLSRIDEILYFTALNLNFAEHYITEQQKYTEVQLTVKQVEKYSRYAVTGLRCMVLKKLTGFGYRELSIRIAESPLMQHFCHIGGIDKIKVPSKSQLRRYSVFVSDVRNTVKQLEAKVSSEDNVLNLKNPFNSEDIYVDATCLKSNIHFPVDWLLLRYGMISLLQSIHVIRKHGLKHRMKPPEEFLNKVNNLCIEMTNTRRKPDSKKARKEVFRNLKSLSKIIRVHASRNYNILKENW